MNQAWLRPFFQDSGQKALSYFVVLAQESRPWRVSASRHRVRGLPPGLESVAYQPGQGGYLEDLGSPVQLHLRAEWPDGPDLLNWRDLIGLLTALSQEPGCSGLYDLQTMTHWSPRDWEEQVFLPDQLLWSQQVVVLASAESEGTWLHTRGMRKFARPDLSLRLRGQGQEQGLRLIERLIDLMVGGGVVSQGQEIRLEGWPAGWACFLQGHLEDPDFNNFHLEIRPADDP